MSNSSIRGGVNNEYGLEEKIIIWRIGFFTYIWRISRMWRWSRPSDTKKDANGTMKDTEENFKDAVNNVEEKLEDNGVGDGVDQDNGISDGEKKDELDNKNQ
jgi:hypothetical protein